MLLTMKFPWKIGLSPKQLHKIYKLCRSLCIWIGYETLRDDPSVLLGSKGASASLWNLFLKDVVFHIVIAVVVSIFIFKSS